MPYKPEVRREELTIREVGQELVVYDARHRCAHRLNKAAAPILQASDGTRTVDELALLVSDDLGVKEKTELVWVTLQDLSRADLLRAAIAPPRNLDRTRRNLLQKAAVMSLTLPVVESIAAPSAKAHATGRWEHDRGDRRRDSDDRRSSDRDHRSDR